MDDGYRLCRRCFGIAQHVSLMFENKRGNRFQSETPNARFAASDGKNVAIAGSFKSSPCV